MKASWTKSTDNNFKSFYPVQHLIVFCNIKCMLIKTSIVVVYKVYVSVLCACFLCITLN